MAAVNSYARLADFWLKYSVPAKKYQGINGVEFPPERKKLGVTKILLMLRDNKKIVDTNDAAMAREKYSSHDEFAQHFSYRKGSKKVVLSSVAEIARRYRKLEGHPRFWDFDEDKDEEIEGDND
jgi:hypothetical protein